MNIMKLGADLEMSIFSAKVSQLFLFQKVWGVLPHLVWKLIDYMKAMA